MKSPLSAFKVASPTHKEWTASNQNKSSSAIVYNDPKLLFSLPKNLIEDTVKTLESIRWNFDEQIMRPSLIEDWKRVINPYKIQNPFKCLEAWGKSFIKISPKFWGKTLIQSGIDDHSKTETLSDPNSAAKMSPVVLLKRYDKPLDELNKRLGTYSGTDEIKIDSTLSQDKMNKNSLKPLEIIGENEIFGETNSDHTESDNGDNREKVKNFNRRIDVVRKSILRSMKKFYFNDFKSYFDFTKKNRKYTPENIQRIRNNLRNYIIEKFGQENIDEMYPYILSLIDNKLKFWQRGTIESEINFYVNSILRSYNQKKYEILSKESGFSKMVNHFLNQDQNVHSIVDGKLDPELKDIYTAQIAYIKHH